MGGCCSVRKGQLLRRWIAVAAKRGTVFVRRGKGGKDRYVPIDESALFWLRLYLQLVRPHFVTGTFAERLFCRP